MNFERKEQAPGNIRTFKSFILLLVFIFLSTQDLRAQKTVRLNDREINIEELNSQIRTMMGDLDIPGFSLTLIDEGQIVFNEVYGLRKQTGKKKVNRRTVFESCSLSKTLLVLAVHQLVDQGKLDLDKPLHEYREHPRITYDPRYKEITGRMVLSHSSGLENWASDNNGDTLEIMHDPGTAYRYSGEGYNYLADVMETILGQTHEEYMDAMVIKPLKLKNTYLKFEERKRKLFAKTKPSNYASGHNVLNWVYKKWQNETPVPSSAVNQTSVDYAKVALAIFDEKHLSKERIQDIITPVVRHEPDDPNAHGGPGFTILYADGDTLVSQWGSNGGYKAEFIYSTVSKSGFVFFSNHDRGWAVASQLNKLTTQFNEGLFDQYSDFEEYYPSVVTDLLTKVKAEGEENMIAYLTDLHNKGGITARQLNEFSREMDWSGYDLTDKVLKLNQKLNPDSPDAFALMGERYYDEYNYPEALKLLNKAEELGFDKWSLQDLIIFCQKEQEKREFNCANPTRLTAKGQTTLQAEDYCSMQGLGSHNTTDEGGSIAIDGDDAGAWLEYKIQVDEPGTYAVQLRMASPEGEGKLTLQIDDAPVITVTDLQSTEDWFDYAINNTIIELPAGIHVLKLKIEESGWNLNWLAFEAVSAKGSH